jgi:glutathione S-transferase
MAGHDERRDGAPDRGTIDRLCHDAPGPLEADAMTDELVFYTNPMSRGRIIRWMLEEVGQPYQTEILDYGTTMKAPAYLAINPMGKVPAVRHGTTVITECAAICAYLADAFPAAGLAPPHADRARGPYYRWLFFGSGPLEAAWTDKAMGLEITPEWERRVGYGTLGAVLDNLEGAIARAPYLAGDTFSAADLYIASSLGFGMQFGMIDKRPVFVDYVGRLSARPARRRADQLDGPMPPPR